MNGVLSDEQEKEIGIMKGMMKEITSSIIALVVLIPAAYMWVNQIAMYEGQTAVVTAVVTHYIIKKAQE